MLILSGPVLKMYKWWLGRDSDRW